MARTIIIYMTREWSTWFLGCLFFLISTIFLFSIVEDFGQVFPRGTDYLLEDFWYWLLGFLPWLLPICCLVSSLFTLSFVKKRGEWSAILSNGISPWQCFSLIICLGISVGWLSDRLMDIPGNQPSQVNDSLVSNLKMQIGSERLWYFRTFDPSTLTGNDLQLFCYGNNGEDVMRVRAKRASWNCDNGWTFYKGRFLGFYSSKGLPVIDQDGKSLKWETDYSTGEIQNSYQTKSPRINKKFEELSGLDLSDDPTSYLLLHKRAKDMTNLEIDRLLEGFQNSKSEEMIPYRLRKAQLWWNGPGCLVALLIGLGIGSSRGASTPAKLGGISLLGALGFYLVSTLSGSLGEQRILSPFISASLPYIFVILGTIFFIKTQK